MTMICKVGPTTLPVAVEAARGALRVDGEDLDAQISAWVRGIVADLEHEIGQCVMKQEWEVRLPCFPAAPIKLPHPVIEVSSVKFIDADGIEQTLTDSAYRINRARYESSLTPARDTSWPATSEGAASVTITVKCGYGADSSATPPEIELYILAKLAEQFDPATRTERDTVQSNFVSRLLDRCRSNW